jgi:hypothetical protein
MTAETFGQAKAVTIASMGQTHFLGRVQATWSAILLMKELLD